MATYVPNATQATEPVESRTVESAALEFRTLKERVNTLADTVEAGDVQDLRVPETSVQPLPSIAGRAGKVLGFDAGGNPTMVSVAGAEDPSLRADLAASGGSAMIGYLPAGTGAVATDVESKLREVESQEVIGNQATSYNLVGVALRRDTAIDPEWFLISDSQHIPVNVSEVALQSVNLRMSYSGENIGTMIVGPDETLASDGVATGASVGASFCDISMGAPCSFVIDFDNSNAIAFSSRYFDASRFSVSVSSGGLVTISHPTRRLMQQPIIQHSSSNSSIEDLTVHRIDASSVSNTSCFLLGEAEGLISYSGSEWTIGSSSWSSGVMTFSFNSGTGMLTVTHPTVVGSPGVSVTPWDNGADVFCHVANVSATGFTVKFRKLDGTIPTLSSALGFYFSRGKSAFRKVPTGTLHVYLGYVQVNMAHVDFNGANGNIWTFGVMEK